MADEHAPARGAECRGMKSRETQTGVCNKWPNIKPCVSNKALAARLRGNSIE